MTIKVLYKIFLAFLTIAREITTLLGVAGVAAELFQKGDNGCGDIGMKLIILACVLAIGIKFAEKN